MAIFFVTSIDSAAMITDMFAAGEENKTPTLYRILWAVLIGAVAAAILVMAPDDGISTLQEVVIIIGLPFFLINFIMMYSLLRGMHDDYAARPEPVTRQWGRTDSAEKLEEHESRPAPGYDDEGNELPRFEFDEDGNLVIPGNVRIQGNLGVDGDVDEDPEPVKENHSTTKTATWWTMKAASSTRKEISLMRRATGSMKTGYPSTGTATPSDWPKMSAAS